MAQHNELGKIGEQKAAEYLKKKGYKILERNYKYKNLEIDIIAQRKTDLVFVEVKTRSDNTLFEPEDAVNYQKQRNITIAASYYYQHTDGSLYPRFDVVAVLLTDGEYHINHIENAFPARSAKRWH
ncbi:MAG: YraN family protein [Paludibacteraceae bacterium]|nr:YraN family protein [Paludibacteraceae bacterium]